MKKMVRILAVLALGVVLLIPSLAWAYQFVPNGDDTLVLAYKYSGESTGDGWVGWFRTIASSTDTNFDISGANLAGSVLQITTGWSGPAYSDLTAVAADLTLYSNGKIWMVRLYETGQGELFLNPTGYDTSIDKFQGTGYIYGGLYNKDFPQSVPVWATSGQVLNSDNTAFIVPVTWKNGEVDIDLSVIAGLDIGNFSFLYASATCANSVLTGTVSGFVPVPIPPSALLLGTGLLGLVGLGWRRRRQSS
jgi:hypothetical protein